jgi:uncharacterized protein with HEPN domain
MYVDDGARLRHMLEAAREAIGFAADCSREDLDTDRKLTLALLKCIEIIGEAAAQITEGTREAHRGIPWSAIVGMRNRLVHGYFAIDLDRVWDTVTVNLPALVTALETIVPPESPG